MIIAPVSRQIDHSAGFEPLLHTKAHRPDHHLGIGVHAFNRLALHRRTISPGRWALPSGIFSTGRQGRRHSLRLAQHPECASRRQRPRLSIVISSMPAAGHRNPAVSTQPPCRQAPAEPHPRRPSSASTTLDGLPSLPHCRSERIEFSNSERLLRIYDLKAQFLHRCKRPAKSSLSDIGRLVDQVAGEEHAFCEGGERAAFATSSGLLTANNRRRGFGLRR